MANGASFLMKQYRDLIRNIESFSDGQATVKHVGEDEDDLRNVYLTFNIKGGLYRGAIIDFKMRIGDDFPSSPPTITCLTEIYHPNLDFYEDYDEDDGNVCLNLFDEHWSESCTYEDVVQGLLFLIHNPNVSDPLNSLFCGDEEGEEFEKDIRASLRGRCVQGSPFKRVLPDDYESDFDDEGEDTPKTVPESVLTETTRDNVLTKQESVEPPLVATVVVANDRQDQATQALLPPRLPSLLRNAFSNVEKLFSGYFASRQSGRTIIESSVDPINFEVCVT